MPVLGAQDLAQIQLLMQKAASLLLYQAVFDQEVGAAFLRLLHSLRNPDPFGMQCLAAYGQWFRALATQQQNWQDYLLTQVLRAQNPFTEQAQRFSFNHIQPVLVTAAKQDLQSLQPLYQCSSEQLRQWVQVVSGMEVTSEGWEGQPVLSPLPKTHWERAIADLAAYYHQHGTGQFAAYRAFRWQSGAFIGIPHPDPIQLTELLGYEGQRNLLLKNTEFLLAGYPALHVLLYGSRGSGKSSMVKALLNHYQKRPLRLIEVAKSDLRDLSLIADQVRELPQKFVLFVDDLSFEEDDEAFKALKVVLEGNLTARPQNLVVYATSNRRHLIREYFDDRPRPQDADEVHHWDTVQEKLSFSDRFGLTLTFEPADQPTYLDIVRHLAQQAQITLDPKDLEYRALQWATRHNGRSGRTARQFVDFLRAELALDQPVQ